MKAESQSGSVPARRPDAPPLERVASPRIVLFDWHATLADTLDAMYYALDEVLPRLKSLGLAERLVPPERSRTVEDARLVKYIRENGHLHPKVKAQRRISRTDIFELLFGDDEEAKRIAHAEFDRSYERYFGPVKSMEPDARARLERLRAMGLKLGVLSNRARRFMAHEIYTIDSAGWQDLFDTVVCGDEVERRKPFPDLVVQAVRNLGAEPDARCWYVGDSIADVVAGKEAGVTAIFYNGVHWDDAWICRIFPGTERFPHRPDAVVESLEALTDMIAALREKHPKAH